VHELQDAASPPVWRLLRVLLLWIGEVSADPAANKVLLGRLNLAFYQALPRLIAHPGRGRKRLRFGL